jgi:hypothetical protein
VKNPVLTTLGVILLLWAGLNVFARIADNVASEMIPIVVLLSAVPVYWLVSRQPRPKPVIPGQCPACGYDLTGNVSGTCPECGGKVG